MTDVPVRSRIEVDPNAESGQEEPVEVLVKEDVSICRRFCVQMSTWREHLSFYIYDYSLCLVLEMLAISLVVCGLVDWDNKVSYQCTACFLQPLIFLWFYLRTPEGPPFLGDKKGNKLEPKYKLMDYCVPTQDPIAVPIPSIKFSTASLATARL